MKNILGLGLVFIVLLSVSFAQERNPTAKSCQDWWVLVILKNSSEIRGVVFTNRFIEEATVGGYKQIKNKRRPGAGIRVWYISTGFVFINYTQVKEVVKLRRLKPRELEEEKELIHNLYFRTFDVEFENNPNDRTTEFQETRKRGSNSSLIFAKSA